MHERPANLTSDSRLTRNAVLTFMLAIASIREAAAAPQQMQFHHLSEFRS